MHSVLGEVLIFRRLRQGTVVPTVGAPWLLEKHVRFLWATWHIASLFGWAMAAILLALSQGEAQASALVHAIAIGMFASGVLVFVATQAKHPGWLGLIGVALLCWWA